ncbi:MAG TPA: DEAD/DEAH box helicase family protein [Candidatus Omnitrophota bacterium]|nr:DEAD/DEAH box helicase family protein [Candidatus Omnitrophota bacterium]
MKNTSLRLYQVEAVDKALKAYTEGHRGFLCGDSCGLGKTIVALSIAERLPKTHNMIAVVCPAFVKSKWQREIRNRCDDTREYKFAIYSYTDLTDSSVLSHAKSTRYDLIIFDECHYSKNYKAARTIATLCKNGIQSVADKLLGLSATFPPNNIADCYQWLKASVSPLAAHSYEEFCREFAANCYRNNFGLQVSGFKPNERWMEYFPPVYIGRTIDDVTNEIPEGLRVDEEIDLPSVIENAEIKLFGRIIDDPDLMQKAIEASPSFDQLTEFRKMQGLAKVHAVIDYALDAWESNEKKLLIFTYHTEVAEKIAAALVKKKLPVTLITGTNTDADERDAITQKLNDVDESVIVATIDSLKEGVDITGFALTLFAEIDWRAYALEQCEGRTRRIGQEKNVRWVYFFFERGVDKMMRKKIAEKQELATAIRRTV